MILPKKLNGTGQAILVFFWYNIPMKTDPFLDNSSSKKSWVGAIERGLKSVRPVAFGGFYLLVVLICLICLSLALSCAVGTYQLVISWGHKNLLTQGAGLALGFLAYGTSLLIIVPLMNQILFLPKLVKPFRGNAYSLETMPWFLHNALLYIVRYSFLEFFTPSPFNVLFYKAMGMKVGKGVIINTTNISDACLISLGDYVTIGGSAHLLTHYSAGGYLIVSTLTIGTRSTIGLKATVFGGSSIGSNCTITPHTVILPKSSLPDNTKV